MNIMLSEKGTYPTNCFKLGKWKKLSRFTNADRYKQSVWKFSWYVDKGGFKDGKDKL